MVFNIAKLLLTNQFINVILIQIDTNNYQGVNYGYKIIYKNVVR